MFASSQTDKAKAKQISDSVKEAIAKGGVTASVREVLGGTVDNKGKGNAKMKGPGGAEKNDRELQQEMAHAVDLLPSMQYLNKALENEIQQGKLELRLEPRGLVVSLRQAAFFPSGEDTVDPKTYPAIEKIAQTIRDLPNAVRLEGHTDSVPIHTARFRSNWELSAARGIAMMELLGERFTIPRNRLAIAGYAETAPVAPNDTESGRARNRRVDIVILNQQAFAKEAPPALAGEAKPPEARQPAAPEPQLHKK
jgi:chemotaxis protein MotB